MTRNIGVVVGIILILNACSIGFGGSNKPQAIGSSEAGLKIQLNNARIRGGSRSIGVEPSTIKLDTFQIKVTSKNGFSTRTQIVGGTAASFSDLEAGTWNISVTALVGGNAVATGESDGNILSVGETKTVAIMLELMQTTTGGFALTLIVPQSAGVDYVSAAMSTMDGTTIGSILSPSFQIDGGKLRAQLQMDGIESGAYLLSVEFRRGGATGSVAGIFGEAVNIWDNVISNKWLDPTTGIWENERSYSDSDFFSANSSISNLEFSDFSGVLPLSPNFSSLTHSFSTATYSSAVAIRAANSFPGQGIEYRVNGASWVSMQSNINTGSIVLIEGDNVVDIRVTAADRATQSIYTT